MFAPEPTGFEAWWTEFLNIAYPAIQMVFWLVMIFVAIYAVLLFKRWVDVQTGRSTGETPTGAAGDETDSGREISVEEFVE